MAKEINFSQNEVKKYEREIFELEKTTNEISSIINHYESQKNFFKVECSVL